MKIGVLTTSYPRWPEDFAGNFVADLAAAWTNAGDQIEVIAPWPARSIHQGIAVHSLRYAKNPHLFYGAGAPDNLRLHFSSIWHEAPRFLNQMWWETRRHLKRWDALVSHWLLPCSLIGASLAHGRPHLCIAHSSDVHLLANLPARTILLDFISNSGASLLCTSQPLKEKLASLAQSATAKKFVEQAQVERMGFSPPAPPISEEEIAQLKTSLLSQAPHLLVFVGRLVPVKGLDLLIAAITDLPHVHLAVIGDGPQRPALEAQARAARAPVQFLGELTGRAKDLYLAAADLFILPSRIMPDGRTDSAPVVLLEAMNAGTPVITTSVGGNSELLTHNKTGFLVDPESPAALRLAISSLLASHDQRQEIGTAAKHFAQNFLWEVVAPRIRRLLDK